MLFFDGGGDGGQNQSDIQNSKSNYAHLGNYDIPQDRTLVEVTYPPDIKGFIYVSYGSKNHNQAYGGGTAIIHRNESKPCFLPVYIPGNGTIKGHIYIYNDVPTNTLKFNCLNNDADFLVTVYVTK